MKHADTTMPPNGSLNQKLEMYYSANWQLLEERIDDDVFASGGPGVDRRIEYVWGPRYIDDVIARWQTDLNTQNTDVWYHLTDGLFSTVAIIDDKADLIERVSYDAYGQARHHRMADLTGNGAVTTSGTNSDQHLLETEDWLDYGIGDLNRDGVVNSTDVAILQGNAGAALTAGYLSQTDNIIGFAGYVFNAEHAGGGLYTVRFRVYSPDLGRWITRDPIGYVDGMNLYEYVGSSPQRMDAFGLFQVDATFRYYTFIPTDFVNVGDGYRYAGDGAPNDWSYSRQSFRIRHTVYVQLNNVAPNATPRDLAKQVRETGVSIQYEVQSFYHSPSLPKVWIDSQWYVEIRRAQIDPKKAMDAWVHSAQLRRSSGGRCCVTDLWLVMKGKGPNPVGPWFGPAIDYRVSLRFWRRNCDEDGTWTGEGTHDGFPSHAFFANKQLKYRYTAVGQSPYNLFGCCDQFWAFQVLP